MKTRGAKTLLALRALLDEGVRWPTAAQVAARAGIGCEDCGRALGLLKLDGRVRREGKFLVGIAEGIDWARVKRLAAGPAKARPEKARRAKARRAAPPRAAGPHEPSIECAHAAVRSATEALARRLARVPAPEAKERRRPSFEEMLEAVRTGRARVVEKPVVPRPIYDGTLAGNPW